VAHDDRLLLPEFLDQGDHVADEVEQGVRRHVRRLLAAGVAALVGATTRYPAAASAPDW
jgi:glycerol dehydrogenase-like iron-containing ADH family enzyme